MGARVVVCGSTLEGEERMLLEAWPAVLAVEPRAVMVLAPRRTERFDAVAGLVAASGFGVVRASDFRGAAGWGGGWECFSAGYDWGSGFGVFAGGGGVCGRKPGACGWA